MLLAISLVPRAGRRKKGLVPFVHACTNYPKKIWGGVNNCMLLTLLPQPGYKASYINFNLYIQYTCYQDIANYAYRLGSTADVVVLLVGVLEMFCWTSLEDPSVFYKCSSFHTTMASAVVLCTIYCFNKPNFIMQMIGNRSLVILPNLV